MKQIPEVVSAVGLMPIEHVLGLIALAVIGLAAFAIHAISSVARKAKK